jgi:hypothetical protein
MSSCNSITLQIVTSKAMPDESAVKLLLQMGTKENPEFVNYDCPKRLKTVFLKLINRNEHRELIQAFEEKSQDDLLIGKLHKSLQNAKNIENKARTDCENARVSYSFLFVFVYKLYFYLNVYCFPFLGRGEREISPLYPVKGYLPL